MKIKNISGEDRTIGATAGAPGGRLVLKGAKIEVDAAEVYLYTQQETLWAPADKDAEAAHAAGHAAYLERLAAENPAPAPDEDEDQGDDLAEPAGNASRDEWAAYVVGRELATEDEIADLSRDEIRDTYKSQEG